MLEGAPSRNDELHPVRSTWRAARGWRGGSCGLDDVWGEGMVENWRGTVGFVGKFDVKYNC